MNEFEPLQPPLSPSDESIIRDMMDKRGVSFAEARREWEMTKAQLDQARLEQEQRKEWKEDE